MNKKLVIALFAAISMFSAAPASYAVEMHDASAHAPMLPLRQAAESIGAKVKWDNQQKRVTVEYDRHQWAVRPGEAQSEIDGDPFELSAAASYDDKAVLLVPVDDFNRALDVKIDWSAKGEPIIRPTDVKTKASRFVKLLESGQTAQARSMMSDDLKKALPESMLKATWQQLGAMFGTLTALKERSEEITAVHQNVRLLYQNGQGMHVSLELRFDADNKLNDMYIPYSMAADTYKSPSYYNPAKFTEQEVVVGTGKLALPGTLTIPVGEGPFPAVVLVQGSGPNDRDESMGGSKMFRDLAGGLANHGIAVLRYEKRTREHPFKSQHPKFSVRDETIDDAIAAIQVLKTKKQIDPKRLFVLGHSQGGMLVPRMIEQDQDKAIAGAMIMAGPAGSIEDVMAVQFKGMVDRAKQAGAPQETIAQLEAQAKQWDGVLALLNNPAYSAANLPPSFPMPNAYWWFDFRNYKGGEIAKSQSVPLFIAQGDNDVQVDKTHLDGWKSALAERKNVTYKLYQKLNHFFTPYDKPSTGEEYGIPANVPETVIEDLAKWVKETK
ncbi:alpha/beta fold hydrolase [Paenibacillus sp. MSJ-34]|uniref:alpha/beta fold hydrolase n=1 Tax=Paenibacillus sp. MSJ-34 TaxID=2841529 RepID=UPI001C0FA441|nr:alpha/beta fold hydrolase [Paenibacillus sp. MSJ-34]MBU5441483.1 alpha/beta hydrolase [Paenibacillus sp. MSJ-34]